MGSNCSSRLDSHLSKPHMVCVASVSVAEFPVMGWRNPRSRVSLPREERSIHNHLYGVQLVADPSLRIGIAWRSWTRGLDLLCSCDGQTFQFRSDCALAVGVGQRGKTATTASFVRETLAYRRCC